MSVLSTSSLAQREVLTSPEGSEPELLAIMIVRGQSNRDHVNENHDCTVERICTMFINITNI
jgi:hypothetical protein